jgi:hypothetical protein
MKITPPIAVLTILFAVTEATAAETPVPHHHAPSITGIAAGAAEVTIHYRLYGTPAAEKRLVLRLELLARANCRADTGSHRADTRSRRSRSIW